MTATRSNNLIMATAIALPLAAYLNLLDTLRRLVAFALHCLMWVGCCGAFQCCVENSLMPVLTVGKPREPLQAPGTLASCLAGALIRHAHVATLARSGMPLRGRPFEDARSKTAPFRNRHPFGIDAL